MGTVRVSLSKQEHDFHFRAVNEAGHFVDIDDASAYEDGKGRGVGPMQLLIMALGGCSGVDVMSILKKGRHEVDRFEIEVTGQKPDGATPSIYHDIHVRYIVEGSLDASKVRRAIELSLGKYCSVSATLAMGATIRYDYEVNGELFEGGSI